MTHISGAILLENYLRHGAIPGPLYQHSPLVGAAWGNASNKNEHDTLHLNSILWLHAYWQAVRLDTPVWRLVESWRTIISMWKTSYGMLSRRLFIAFMCLQFGPLKTDISAETLDHLHLTVEALDLALRLEILMDESVQFTVQVPSFIPETNVVHSD